MPNQNENLEERLRQLQTQVSQVTPIEVKEDLQRQIDELRAQIESSKRFVDSEDLKGTLKNVNSNRVLPKGKYIVDFDIIIHPQAVLEIQPGTEIYFGPEGGIISYGILKAIGIDEEKITFTSSGKEWKNIAIAGKLSSESVLEYCKVANGSGRERIPRTNYFEKISFKGEVGGGLFIASSDPTIKYCEIEDNQAKYGGGICLSHSESTLENTIVTNNKAQYTGGGFCCRYSHPTIKSTKVIDNWAVRRGGGLHFYNSDPTLEENIIKNNKANMDGGGICFWRSCYNYLGNCSIANNTITNNSAKSGGGLYLFSSSPIIKEDNTIKDNKPDDIKVYKEKK